MTLAQNDHLNRISTLNVEKNKIPNRLQRNESIESLNELTSLGDFVVINPAKTTTSTSQKKEIKTTNSRILRSQTATSENTSSTLGINTENTRRETGQSHGPRGTPETHLFQIPVSPRKTQIRRSNKSTNPEKR